MAQFFRKTPLVDLVVQRSHGIAEGAHTQEQGITEPLFIILLPTSIIIL